MSHERIGWKGIADFFNVSARTIRRWNDYFPLPIYRLVLRGEVRAHEKDLRKWKKKRMGKKQNKVKSYKPLTSGNER